MDGAAITRLDFDRLDPFVFGEMRFNDHALVRHGSGGVYGYRLGELEHGIRLADEPAFGERMGLRSIAFISLRLIAIDPAEQVTLLGFRQRPVISPQPVLL